jgi:RNA polymerase sigma-70 factor (ECF subfamily)
VYQSGNQHSNASQLEQSIVAAREGSFSIVGQLLNHYRGYLLRMAHDEISTELMVKVAPSDLVQDTCLQAARDFPDFTGRDEAALRAWLRQILLHNLKDLQRHYSGAQKRAVEREIRFNGPGSKSELLANIACPRPMPSEQAISAETRQALDRAVGALPVDYQRVVRMRNFESRSFAAIGLELGRSGEAARKLWVRAIEQLANTLDVDDSTARSTN